MPYAGEEVTPFASQQTAVVALAGAGSVTVAGIAGKRIVVLYGFLAAGTTATSYLIENSGGTDITGTVPIGSNIAHEFVPPKGVLVWKCIAGEGLKITAGAGAVNGWVVYTLVQDQ